MYHRLFVTGLVETEGIGILMQRLTDTSNVSVPEDSEHTGKKLGFVSISFDILLSEKLNDGLSHREFLCFHESCCSFGTVVCGCGMEPKPNCIYHPPRSATNSSTSGIVGIKFAQPCRVTTIAPVALPSRADFRQPQPLRCP